MLNFFYYFRCAVMFCAVLNVPTVGATAIYEPLNIKTAYRIGAQAIAFQQADAAFKCIRDNNNLNYTQAFKACRSKFSDRNGSFISVGYRPSNPIIIDLYIGGFVEAYEFYLTNSLESKNLSEKEKRKTAIKQFLDSKVSK